jgi:hypothetical protein
MEVLPLHGVHATLLTCTCRNAHGRKDVGKHPATRDGVRGATRDLSVVRTAFETRRNRNLGIATGWRSRIWVLDVDVPADLDKLIRQYGELPATMSVTTNRGHHLYFRYPNDGRVPSRNKLAGLGLDVKSDNGFVVGPGSLHESGRRYRLVRVPPLHYAPQWLVELTREGARPKSATTFVIPEGVPPMDALTERMVRHGGELIQARFQRSAERLQDRSESSIDASLLRLLVLRGNVRDPAQLQAALFASWAEAGMVRQKRDLADYLRRSIETALRGFSPSSPSAKVAHGDV